MVISRITATPDTEKAAAARARGGLGISLYDIGTPTLPGLGRQLLDSVFQLSAMPSQVSWDFLSFALAVFAADRFVMRRDSPDGWTRVISLEVDLFDPNPWRQATRSLAALLRFLTGDIWYITFNEGGLPVPGFDPSLTDRDCVCLFSGGMDSFIGAGNLVQSGRRPVLASQASPKEIQTQQYLAERIGLADHRFDGRARERFAPPYEPSSRGRSLLFIAYGLLAATSLRSNKGKAIELFIPENGFISMNPPLTLRRLGSLSTRTTHPFFIASLQGIIKKVGMNVILSNPYAGSTKGEMIADTKNPTVLKYLRWSYSCGKGKRINMHCGRCVPCLIRRAAFHRADMADKTGYAVDKLAAQSGNDDVFSMRYAIDRYRASALRWAHSSGPIPSVESKVRKEVVRRGLNEMRTFLASVKWL